MSMENAEYETLCISSFSKSWLINSSPLQTGAGCSLRSESKRCTRDSQHSDFHFPDSSNTPVHLVHADDIFRNGQILPRTSSFLTNVADDTFGLDASRNLPVTVSSTCKNLVSSSSKKAAPTLYKMPSLKSCRTVVSKSRLHKYLSCLQPFFTCRRGASSKVVENYCTPSLRETLPRTSVASYSVDGRCRRSSSSQSSIDEAVLHCKRSISK